MKKLAFRVFLFSLTWFFLTAFSSSHAIESQTTRVNRVFNGQSIQLGYNVSVGKESTQTATARNNQKKEGDWAEWLRKYDTLIGAAISLFATLAALFLGLKGFERWIIKPAIKVHYEPDNEAYRHRIIFGHFGNPLRFGGREFFLQRPGFNSRIKIANEGRDTAKGVQVSIEKIELYDSEKNLVKTEYYHPTTIKWSGEKNWEPVDIVRNSHFFLDLFYSKNETVGGIIEFNDPFFGAALKLTEDFITKCLKGEYYSNDIYWNVWVESPQQRGIPSRYDHEGLIDLFFILNAENVRSSKFKVHIKWEAPNWDKPQIDVQT